MDLPTDVPTQRYLSWVNEQWRRKTELKGMLAGVVSSVFLVISQPLCLQAKLNPKTPAMAVPLLAQILKRKPLLTLNSRRENESERHPSPSPPHLNLKSCNSD